MTQRRSPTTLIVSAVKSAPRPSAPSAQWSTELPGKCPPQRTTVTPGSSSRASPSKKSMTGSGSHHPGLVVGVEWIGTFPSARLHSIMLV